MVPHRMTAWNGWNTALCWGLTENDVSPVFTPLYHAGGLGAFLVPILAAGGTIVLHAGFDPAEVWATVAKERCTVVLGVPTIWKLLLEHPSFETADLSSIRWLISGGAPLPLYLIDAYQERGSRLQAGLRPDGGRRQLLRDVRRGVGREEGLDRAAAHDDRRQARRRGGARGAGRRGGRALPARAARLEGLLEEPRRHGRRARRRRLLPHGRPRAQGRRRLLHDRRAPEGHAHLGRRERLPGRDRRRASPSPGRPGRGRRRRPRPDLGRGRRRVRRDAAGREPHEGGAPRLRRGAPRALQAPEGGRLRRRPPAGRRTARSSRASCGTDTSPREEAGERARVLAHRVDGRGRAAPPPERRDDELRRRGTTSSRRSRSATGSSAATSAGSSARRERRPPTFAGPRGRPPRASSTTSGSRTCHVVGTSFGAFAAVHLAALAPDRVASLVAMTVADRVSGEMWAEAREMAAACREALAGGSRETVYDLDRGLRLLPGLGRRPRGGDRGAPRPRRAPARRLVRGPREPPRRARRARPDARSSRGSPAPPSSSSPTATSPCRFRTARALASGLPRGELAVVRGGGHALVVEKPRRDPRSSSSPSSPGTRSRPRLRPIEAERNGGSLVKPIYIAAYHQSKFGKLLGMTVPEILRQRRRGDVRLGEGRSRRPSTSPRSAPSAT